MNIQKCPFLHAIHTVIGLSIPGLSCTATWRGLVVMAIIATKIFFTVQCFGKVSLKAFLKSCSHMVAMTACHVSKVNK